MRCRPTRLAWCIGYLGPSTLMDILMYTVSGVVLQFLQIGRADPAPGFWWTILVAYLAPRYKEETEAPRGGPRR